MPREPSARIRRVAYPLRFPRGGVRSSFRIPAAAKGLAVMFTIYLDDSGTSPSQKIAVATAMIIPALEIVRMETEWEALTKKEGFSSLHASECAANNPKSEFATWDRVKQERVFRRAREISRKYGTTAFSFSVNKKDYDEVLSDEWRNHFGIYHYTWAIRHVLKFVDQWNFEHNKMRPLEYVFDWMGGAKDKRRKEVERVMEQAEHEAIEHKHPGQYTNFAFRNRKDTPGLQCVDLLAWLHYQTVLHDFQGIPRHPLAEIAFQEYEKPPFFLHAVTVRRKNLQRWMAEEAKNPKAIELLRKWGGFNPTRTRG